MSDDQLPGHRAYVLDDGVKAQVSCGCGTFASQPQPVGQDQHERAEVRAWLRRQYRTHLEMVMLVAELPAMPDYRDGQV